MRIRSVFIIVLLILALTLAAQNTLPVDLELFFWSIKASQALLLVGALAVGVLVGVLVARPWKSRKPKPLKKDPHIAEDERE